MKKKVTIVLAVLLIVTMSVVVLTACNSRMSKKSYDDIICATQGETFVASKDGKFYLFNLKGKQLSPGYDLELSITEDGDYLLGRSAGSFGYDLLSADGSVLLQSSADFRISAIEITTDRHVKGMVGTGNSSDYTLVGTSEPVVFASVSAKNTSEEDVSELYFFNSGARVTVSDSEVLTVEKTEITTANGVREASSVISNVAVVNYLDNAEGVLISSVDIYDVNGEKTATYNPGDVQENDFTDVSAEDGRLFIDGNEGSYLVPYTMSGDLIDVADCDNLTIGKHNYLYKLIDMAKVKVIDLENDAASIIDGESCGVVGDYIEVENDGTYNYYDENLELKKTLDYSVTSYADGVYYVGGQKLLNANLEEKIVDFGGFRCSYVDGDDVYGLYTTTVSGSTELFYCNKGVAEGVGISLNASINANGRYATIVDGERTIVFDLKTKNELNMAYGYEDSEVTAIVPDDDAEIYARASDEELRIYYGGNYDTYTSDENVQYTLLSTKVELYEANKELENFGLYSVKIQKSTDTKPTNIYIMRVNDSYEVVYRGFGTGSLTYGSFNLLDKKQFAVFSVAGACEGLAANVKIYDLSISYSDNSEDYSLTLNSARELLIPNAGITIMGDYLVVSNDVNDCHSIYDMNGTLKVGPKFVVESMHGNCAVVYLETSYDQKVYGVIEITKKGYKMKEDLKYNDISGFGDYYLLETEKDGISHIALKTFDGDKLVKDSLGITIIEEMHLYINDAKATIALKVFDDKGWKVLFLEVSAYDFMEL